MTAVAASDTQIDLSWTAPDGEPTVYEVEWSSDGSTNWTAVSPAHGGTGTTYSHTGFEAETAYSDRARAAKDDVAGEWSGSAAAMTQATPNRPATGAPAVTGTAQLGETLTVDTSGIADEDGLQNATFTCQWLADGVVNAGATRSTYLLGGRRQRQGHHGNVVVHGRPGP